MLTAAVTVSAGQIQIGGTNGITNNYITGQCMTNGGPSADGCAHGTATLERNYSALFSGATVPGQPDHGTLGVFDLLNDGSTSGGDNNFWLVGTSSYPNLTIPIGLYNVDKVWTMLNDYWGIIAQTPITVTFNFANDSAGTMGLNPVAVTLTENQNVRDALACTGAVPGTGVTCPTFATSLASGTTTPTAGVTVSASNLWMGNYTTATNPPYANTSGTAELDQQLFVFDPSVYLNKYLVSLTVTDSAATQISRAALSAVTVDSTSQVAPSVIPALSPTPEPGTLGLVAAGLLAAGLHQRRKRQAVR
jgi:hypothetical protein